jgi:hypothetical protein
MVTWQLRMVHVLNAFRLSEKGTFPGGVNWGRF